MKKILLMAFLILIVISGISIMSYNDSNLSKNTHQENNIQDIKKMEKDRHFVKHYNHSLRHMLAKTIHFEDVLTTEIKDEHVDFNPNELADILTREGWELSDTEIEEIKEYGDINFYTRLLKNGEEMGLTITSFKAGTDYAAKNFIYDLTQTTMLEPPYVVIPKEQGLGTLALYTSVEQNNIYWFYRNIYVILVPTQELGQPSNLQMELALKVQKVFNEHTKKIE